MNQGTYAAANKISSSILRMNQIAKDMAATTVPGHKCQKSEFGDTVIRELATYGGNGQLIGSLGSGATLLPSYTVFTQGVPKYTGNPHDFAIVTQSGMFAIMVEPNVIRYTRNGTTKLNSNRQLTDAQGKLVLDSTFNPITVPLGKTLAVSNKGELFMDKNRFAQLGIFEGNFTKGIDGWFIAENTTLSQVAEVRSGELESSNANIMELMVENLALFRNIEALQKSISLQDSMTQQLPQALQS